MKKKLKYMPTIRWGLFLIQWAFVACSVFAFYMYYQEPGHKLFNAFFGFFFLGCSYQAHQLMARYYRDIIEAVVASSELDPSKRLNRRGKRRLKKMSKPQLLRELKKL